MKERIRLIQEQLGLSQIEFANKLGISPASLSSIYTGRTNPTNNHVMAIHKAFPQINANPNTDNQQRHLFIYIYVYNPKHTCIFL